MHHSNLIPWQQACRAAGAKLVYLYPDENGVITPEEMDAKIGPKTKILSVVHVSNVLGVQNPVEELGRRVHEQGGYLVVDGAQSTPHIHVDVQAIGADFFAFSAHKLFGPFGMGVLWGRDELLNAMPPFLTGGEMIDSVTEQDATWAPVPEKFEAGTQDAAGIYATAAAIAYVESVGLDVIAAREQALVRYCMEEMAKLPFVTIIGSPDPDMHHGVISFNVDGIHPHDVASILDMDQVAIRAGHHCAQPLLTWLGVENLACCRASLAFYNDKKDVDALIAGLGNVWNPSCGDEMVLKLRIEDGVIEEAAFTGHGCAVSQASADMMADLVTGETVEEARRLCGLFMKMVKGETLTDEEKEDLDEAAQLESISHMPARVKCAELGWRTLSEIIGE